MAAIRSALCVTYLTCWISALASSSEDQREITAKPGDDVTLQCRSPKSAFKALEWIRPELKTDDCVFYFRDDRSYELYQLQSVRGRVQLKDPEMKNGDISVILKNVNFNDTGTYECRVSVDSKRRRKRATIELMNTINLKVEDSGHTAGNTWPEGHKDGGDKDEGDKEAGNLPKKVGLSVALVLLLVAVVVGFVIHRRRHPDQPVHYTEASAH